MKKDELLTSCNAPDQKKTLKQILFVAEGQAALVDAEDRLPGPGEVRLQMRYSAVSAGTERALLTGNRDSEEIFRYQLPARPGYAGSGVITHVGDGVEDFRPGQRVMVHGGGHQQFCTVPQKEIVPVPDNVPLDEAALTIIAGFSLSAVRKAEICLGQSCLVVGAGLLGLFAVQYARLSGAYPVIVSDMNPERRALALTLGADAAFDPSESDYEQRVKAMTFSGKGVETAIEVTGNPKALRATLHCTAKFGRVLLLGCTRTMTEVDFYHDVHWPGIELIGAHSGARPTAQSFRNAYTEMDDCRVTLKYLSAGRLSFRPVIHEVVSPAEAPEVYARLAEQRNFPVGVLFDWSRLD